MVHRGYQGIYQVSVVLPLGDGPNPADGLIPSLDEAFSTTTPLVRGGLTIYITQPMSAGPAMSWPGTAQ